MVHTIEVQLWDKDEHEGLRDIKESLFNFKCYNPDEFVYFYRQDAAKDDSKGHLLILFSDTSFDLSRV